MDLGTLLSTASPATGNATNANFASIISTLQNNNDTRPLLDGLNTQMNKSNSSALVEFFKKNEPYVNANLPQKAMDKVKNVDDKTIVSICSVVGAAIGLALGGAAPVGALIGSAVGFAVVGFIKYVLPLFSSYKWKSDFPFCNNTFKKNNEKRIQCDAWFRIIGPDIGLQLVWIIIKCGERSDELKSLTPQFKEWLGQMKSQNDPNKKQSIAAYWVLDDRRGWLGFFKSMVGLPSYNYVEGVTSEPMIDLFDKDNFKNPTVKSLCAEYPLGMQYLAFVKMRAPDPDHVALNCDNSAATYRYIRDIIQKGPYIPPPPPNVVKQNTLSQASQYESDDSVFGIDKQKAPIYFGAMGLGLFTAVASHDKNIIKV